MAHEIFGERFLSHRAPAWHRLGTIVHEPVGAEDGFQRIGTYTVVDEPVYRRLPSGAFAPLPYRALVRTATADAEEQVFNVVGKDYELIDPLDFCRLWDERVGQPVETLGALREGRQLFITTRLPSLSIKGDELDTYLIALNGMDGAHGCRVMIAPVRVVCANTLSLSDQLATERYTISHTAGARARFGDWLEAVHTNARVKLDTLREVFDILAGRRIDAAERNQILYAAYPEPEPPHPDLPPARRERAEARYTYLRAQAERRRDAADAIWQGDGTGMQHPAMAGTAWGLYNAIVELEDYRRGNGAESAGASALVGKRAQAKTRAFAACLEIIGVN